MALGYGRTGTNNFACSKLIVDTNGLSAGATHTTIASAIADVSAGETIFIKPGTYTEDFTLPADVHLVSFANATTAGQVKIVGKITYTADGLSLITGIILETNGDNFLTVTGSNSSSLRLFNCHLLASDNEGMLINNANCSIVFDHCITSIGGAFALHTITSCDSVRLRYCHNVLGTSTPSTIAAGTVTYDHSRLGYPVNSSGTGIIQTRYCTHGTLNNFTAITTSGTGANNNFSFSEFITGTAACVSYGSGTSGIMSNCILNSTNANPLTGAGTVQYTSLAFARSGSGINVSTADSRPFKSGEGTLDSLILTTDLAVEHGGSGRSSATAYGVICGGTTSTSAQQSIAGVGTSGQVLTSNGAAALPTFQDASDNGDVANESTYYYFEDFYNVETLTSNGLFSTYFYFDRGGSSSIVERSQQDTQTHPGQVIFDTGTTSATTAAIESIGEITLGGGNVELEWLQYLPALSDGTDTYKLYLGFFQDSGVTPTDGVYFTYTHSENSGNWVGNASTSSSTTSANSSDAVAATTWTKLKITVNAAGSSVSFFVDGVEIDNSPITTNIPTAADIHPILNITKSAGSSRIFLIVDYVKCLVNLTTGR